MSAARPLRDVFDELASGGAAATGPADLRQVMAASGYDDLPDALLAEAIVNYADSAPLPVAEQLAPFVQAHSPVSGDAVPEEWADPERGLRLLEAVSPLEPAGEALGAEPELTAAEAELLPRAGDQPAAGPATGEGWELDPAEGESAARDPAFGAGRLAETALTASPDSPSDPYELDFGQGRELGTDWEEPAPPAPSPAEGDYDFTAPDAAGEDLPPPEEPVTD